MYAVRVLYYNYLSSEPRHIAAMRGFYGVIFHQKHIDETCGKTQTSILKQRAVTRYLVIPMVINVKETSTGLTIRMHC